MLVKPRLIPVILLACICHRSAADKPNIIFVLSDDVAQGDLGCYGQQKIETPRLDAMARDGVDLLVVGGGITGAGPTHWYENYNAKNSRLYLLVDPADGKIPAETEEAKRRIEQITAEVEIGKVYEGPVTKILDFGALVNLLPELGSDTITTVLPLPQDESLWRAVLGREGSEWRLLAGEPDDPELN